MVSYSQQPKEGGAMHWDDIVKDMMNKKIQNKPFSFLDSNQADYIDK